MPITIKPQKKDNSESKGRMFDKIGVQFTDTKGNPYNGKYYITKEHDVCVCFLNGYIDSRGNPDKDGSKWAIQYKDGHSEWWRKGVIHRDNNLPAIITDYGSWEEYWDNNQLLLIKTDNIVVDEVKGK